jgi:TatD DNase family protein
MKLLDIHAHLNFPEYDTDREQLIDELKKEELGVINVGTNIVTSREVVSLAETNRNMWATVGIHPHDASESADLVALEDLATSNRVVAIGECGLDYFRLDNESQKLDQEKLFIAQIKLAIRMDKPLMLHIREAYEDVLTILNRYPEVRAHAHFFAGNLETAKQYLNRGCTISFTGVVTFTGAYDEVIRHVPLESLMIETDAPYVAPVPYRGQRNSPLYVSEVAKRIAELKNVTQEEVISASIINAKRVFGLPVAEL